MAYKYHSVTGQYSLEYSWNVMAHSDAREGKWRGNWRMEWVASILHTTSEHGVSIITTADAHTSAASSRRPNPFKRTRPFRRKTKSGFCACAITFQLAPTFLANLSTWQPSAIWHSLEGLVSLSSVLQPSPAQPSVLEDQNRNGFVVTAALVLACTKQPASLLKPTATWQQYYLNCIFPLLHCQQVNMILHTAKFHWLLLYPMTLL